MKTLDYLHLDEKKVQGVVSALHSLLADSKSCTTILPKRPIRSQNAS